MPDIWGSIKDTAESLGGAAYAPAGLVVDLASMPFDSKDDSFGTVVHSLASRAGQTLDPLFNPKTISGGAVSGLMTGANWLLREGISEPISAGFNMASHMDYQAKHEGKWYYNIPTQWTFLIPSGDEWAKAYEIAQNENAGQAFTTAVLTNQDTDPFAYRDPYEEKVKPEHPVAAPILTGTANVIGSWYLDPLILAGKGLSVLKAIKYSHTLGVGERADLYRMLTTEGRTGRFGRNTKARFDTWLDWTQGKNSLGRPLEAPEILHGTPELKNYAADPHLIAGLVADANKIGDKSLARDTARRIMAVAAGDPSQVARLQTQVKESAAIADTLKNMSRGSTLDLERMAADPLFQHHPVFIAKLEQQLDNINDAADMPKAIDKFVDGYDTRLSQILDTRGGLPNLPGVHTQGRRAVNRLSDQGALRAPAKATRALGEKADAYWAQAQSAGSLFQKGRYTVPFLVLKTAGLASSPYTRFPLGVSDALRQTHFTGVAHLHDWGGATTQLDSMMKLAGVQPGVRMKTLSEAFLAGSEPEKLKAIDTVEKLSMKSLASKYSAKYGEELDHGFIEDLMLNHAQKRGARLAQMQGRAYAATEMPDSMLATRGASIGAAEDAASAAGSRGNLSVQQGQGKWRVDQILDDGTPVSLPLLETQLSNSVPLLDMHLADRLLSREFSHMSRLSKAWKQDALELNRLSGLKAAGGQGLEKAIQARRAGMDWALLAGEKAMRVWKFSVLFRLGYPMRVLMDDHWRIWTRINALSFYGDNGKEFLANWRYNRFTRGQEGRQQLHSLKVRRQEILDELESERMVNHLGRQDDLRRISRGLGGHKGQITQLRKQIEEAEGKRTLGLDPGVDINALKAKLAAQEAVHDEKQGAANYLLEQLGDYGPDQLKKELAQIEELILGGAKKLRPEAKTIGTADVALDGGIRAPGAFTGPYGKAWLQSASSHSTFDAQLKGTEDRMYASMAQGAHRTILPGEGGHSVAWADVLNYQFRQSPVAMHFIKGGDVDDFVRWVKAPEQAELRRRLAHFAHDPEDWGRRVQALVHDYIPNDDLMKMVASGRVTPRRLDKMFSDPTHRPAVHGNIVADNIGTSHAQLGVGRAMNSAYKWIGELPTDRLSRHPFFNSMYKMHLREQADILKAGKAGERFTQADVDDLAKVARKLALHDLRRTLFDISAHSHAAHVMRFISPFMAAQQEALSRWWRIIGDDPSVIRRFAQAFDVPRHLNLEVDADGNLVRPGSAIGSDHKIMLQLPRAWGGPDPTKHQSKWQINENAFNLVLQNGVTNPGLGPIAQFPLEYLAVKYADEPEIARVARVFNPYPPNSPMEVALPATLKRAMAVGYAHGVNPLGMNAIGQREYNKSYSQNVQDLVVEFQLANGREPNQAETNELMVRAGRETNTDMFLRLLWNSASPAPATPGSKYSAVQHAWYQISEQARSEGRDYDWAYQQFKEKWGEAYMPLIYSDSNNPAGLTPTASAVSGIKRYRGVLDRVDPALTRMVLGSYAAEGEYSYEARNFLKGQQMKPGNSATYLSNDDPAVAAQEQMARRGWAKYGELTASLTNAAEKLGLNSYRDSDQLMAVRRAAVAQLQQQNWAFAADWNNFDSNEFDRYLSDMRTIVKSPALSRDPERQDVQVLKSYLSLRDAFVTILNSRQAAGLGGPDAQANAGIRAAYTALVGRLVESNTQFEEYMFNGTLERDPLLVGD